MNHNRSHERHSIIVYFASQPQRLHHMLLPDSSLTSSTFDCTRHMNESTSITLYSAYF